MARTKYSSSDTLVARVKTGVRRSSRVARPIRAMAPPDSASSLPVVITDIVLAKNPDFAQASDLRGLVLLNGHEFEKARALLEEAVRRMARAVADASGGPKSSRGTPLT